jgi:prolyl oligopeptidase
VRDVNQLDAFINPRKSLGMNKSVAVAFSMALPVALSLLTPGCQFLGKADDGPSLHASKSDAARNDGTIDFSELEAVDGKRALQWVTERNVESAAVLENGPLFGMLKQEIIEILDAKDRIPSISIRSRGAEIVVENFWQDAKNKKGIFRTQSLEDFREKRENWTTLVDIDKLAADEKENWVFKGLICAPINRDRCLLLLSRGGGDAVVAREYDLGLREFVNDGFSLPEAKVRLDWKTDDSLWVGAPHGADTVSKSGYPVTVRIWTRGQKLSEAPIVYRGKIEDVTVAAGTLREWTPSGERTLDLITRAVSFFQNEFFVQNARGEWKILPLPLDAEIVGLAQGRLVLTFKKSTEVFGRKVISGAVYGVIASRLQNEEGVKLETIFEPTASQAFGRVAVTKGKVLISYLDQVRGRLAEVELRSPRKSGDRLATWVMNPVRLPGQKGTVSIGSARHDEELFTLFYSDFLTPHQMFLAGEGAKLEKLRTTPARFEAKGMKVETRTAISRDGTRVPYFLVLPKSVDRKSGKTPTLIYAYGGFEIPSLPSYLGPLGKVWLEKGGAYVLANIRGGGEFGPSWHQAALREKRQNAFDDLFAVAEEVARLGFTSSAQIGFRGGSNGGLLAGVALTQRPDLFGAIVSQVPLLDMLRFHKLLAGASWVEEYGNPDIPAERATLERYSPFHNVRATAKYPEAFFTTSTRDDRVHPGHARRMVAKLKQLGHPVLYYENIEGGHAGAATNESRAALMAREYSYLWMKLKK